MNLQQSGQISQSAIQPGERLSDASRQLASLVVDYAGRNGFEEVEADAIRETVDQFCKIHNITATEAERIAACEEAERLWRARPSWQYMCEHFSLDESFHYSDEEQQEYYRLLDREDA